jgi:hypothetical protein
VVFVSQVTPDVVPGSGRPITVYGGGFLLGTSATIAGQPVAVERVNVGRLTVHVPPPLAAAEAGAEAQLVVSAPGDLVQGEWTLRYTQAAGMVSALRALRAYLRRVVLSADVDTLTAEDAPTRQPQREVPPDQADRPRALVLVTGPNPAPTGVVYTVDGESLRIVYDLMTLKFSIQVSGRRLFQVAAAVEAVAATARLSRSIAVEGGSTSTLILLGEPVDGGVVKGAHQASVEVGLTGWGQPRGYSTIVLVSGSTTLVSPL